MLLLVLFMSLHNIFYSFLVNVCSGNVLALHYSLVKMQIILANSYKWEINDLFVLVENIFYKNIYNYSYKIARQ